ncbi:MAG TPA: hypothetical protein VGM88_13455 [Kofleriaceae bacterium]|jgi:hypothetical protein
MKSIVALLISSSLVACMSSTGTDGTEDTQDTSTTYVRIQYGPGGDEGAWYDINDKLRTAFDNVCGDTFCEGDYSNITPLTIACSVTSIRGDIHDCAWTFAASQAGVDSTSSVISVNAPTFTCHMKPATTGKKLIATLEASTDIIHEPLPGIGSIYQGLGDCFQHPDGVTPVTATYTFPEKYVSADEYYSTPANQAKWRTAVGNIVDGFNNICGDTFCGSDYSDLWHLQLECSVTKSTGNVKSCDWIFGGSFSDLAANGAITENLHTWTCPFTVGGTLSQLITTWTTGDAIQNPLPGKTTSAYDALGGCLP